jgi:hypothetical protein
MMTRPHQDHNTTRITLTARAFDRELPREFETIGQAAYALLTLWEAAERGATVEECSNGDFDLATGCHDLQCEFSLAIRRDREARPGGQRVRYVLETRIDLLSMERIEGRVA